MADIFKNIITPISLLVGSIVGAGIFALPFAFHKAGVIPTILYLVLFSLITALVHLLYADIIMRTQETRHQFPGYVRIYLGKNAGYFASFVVATTILLTLTAYLILSVSFISLIFPGISMFTALFIFWFLSTAIIFIDISKTALFNTITATWTFALIAGLFLYWVMIHSVPSVIPSLAIPQGLLIPWGPVLFSLLGFSAIPSLSAYFRNNAVPFSTIRKVIVAGSIIPGILYLLFTFAVWGLSSSVSPDSVSGIVAALPPFAILLLGVFGFLSLWDSYPSIGRDLRKIMEYDWKLSPETVMIVISFFPPLLYFLGINNFVSIVSVIGAVLLGIWGILIIITWRKASQVKMPSIKFSKTYIPNHPHALVNSMPTLVIFLTIIIFLGGILYELARLATH